MERNELDRSLVAGQGATKIATTADRPQAIAWYERHWGYREAWKAGRKVDRVEGMVLAQ